MCMVDMESTQKKETISTELYCIIMLLGVFLL